jgi:hypothetical protein
MFLQPDVTNAVATKEVPAAPKVTVVTHDDERITPLEKFTMVLRRRIKIVKYIS